MRASLRLHLLLVDDVRVFNLIARRFVENDDFILLPLYVFRFSRSQLDVVQHIICDQEADGLRQL